MQVFERLKSHPFRPLCDRPVQHQLNKKSDAVSSTLIVDPALEVRKSLALYAGQVGGAEGERILSILMLDRTSEVRREVAFRAAQPGGEGRKRILHLLAQDRDFEVKSFAQEQLNAILEVESSS